MREKECNHQPVMDDEPGEKKLRISRNDAILKLRDASRLLGHVARDSEDCVACSSMLEKADSLIREVVTKHLIFPEGLEQLGPLLSCVSCGRLLFDGGEQLFGDVFGDGSDRLPVSLK